MPRNKGPGGKGGETWESLSATTLGTSASPVVCRIGKRVPTYRRYARNSGQSDSDLLADQPQAEMVIVPGMRSDLLGRHNEVTRWCSRLEAARAGAVCRRHLRSFPLSNCEGSARPADEVVRSDWVVMRSDEVV